MSQPPRLPPLFPEKVAYWYFRLNGFLQIENFVVHPERRGAQRTDADILGVRFPFRAERLFDNPHDIMRDDEARLSLSADQIDVVIAEVKTNQPCTLNGPWTREDDQNVHRVWRRSAACRPATLNRLQRTSTKRASTTAAKVCAFVLSRSGQSEMMSWRALFRL